MIKVLHCLNLLIPGGVERRRMSLFNRLPARTYQHRVVCVQILDRKYADMMRRVVDRIDQTGSFQSIFNLRRYKKTARIVEDWQPDIIHGAIFEGYTLSSIVGCLKKVPTIIMEETSDPKNRRWKGHALSMLMGRMADHCIGNSPSVGSYLVNGLKIPKRKVSVINNGVEQPEETSSDELSKIRIRLGIHDEDIVVGMVARMHDETHKRFGDLIRAFSLLPRQSNVKLLLVGDGPELIKIKALANDLDVLNRVIFAGFQFQVGPFYALMDIFVLSSEREAFGLVIAEAMRCKLPVVATRVGGIPSIVVDGQTGFLVEPRDVVALRNKIYLLLQNEFLRQEMGSAGKVRADRKFSAERYVSDVDSLYKRLFFTKRR
jgi:glycosyltransferase involved in cell wall biosynthesis